MRNIKTKILAAALVPLLLVTSACSVSQQTAALDAVQIAVEGVIAALTIAGKIPPQYAPQIEAWASAATVATGETATELASSDTSAQKSLKIASYWAATSLAFTSLPGQAQAYISLAQALIQDFLNMVAPKGAVANANGTVGYHGQYIPAFIRIDPMNAYKLSKVRSKSQADLIKLNALKN